MDQIFEYESATSETPGRCRVRIYPAQQRTVVVISELADGSGISITPTIEGLAMQICEAFQLDPEQVRWVEHHPVKTTDFPLFSPRSHFIDDTVLTCAVAHALTCGMTVQVRKLSDTHTSCI
jgi:hypothetical protein